MPFADQEKKTFYHRRLSKMEYMGHLNFAFLINTVFIIRQGWKLKFRSARHLGE